MNAPRVSDPEARTEGRIETAGDLPGWGLSGTGCPWRLGGPRHTLDCEGPPDLRSFATADPGWPRRGRGESCFRTVQSGPAIGTSEAHPTGKARLFKPDGVPPHLLT